MTLDQIQDLVQTGKLRHHHTSFSRGYVSRKGTGTVLPYTGRFGTGYILRAPNRHSTQYCFVHYYVEPK